MLGAGELLVHANGRRVERFARPVADVLLGPEGGRLSVASRLEVFSRFVREGVATEAETDLRAAAGRLEQILFRAVQRRGDRLVASEVLESRLPNFRSFATLLGGDRQALGIHGIPEIWHGGMAEEFRVAWIDLYRARNRFGAGVRTLLENQAMDFSRMGRLSLRTAERFAARPALAAAFGALLVVGAWACAATFGREK